MTVKIGVIGGSGLYAMDGVTDHLFRDLLTSPLIARASQHRAISLCVTEFFRVTDAIVSEDYSHTREFLRRVDSSSVMVNASTAFADGFEYGLGAEIGISTDKLHARGPVGLEGLTSQKYVVFGDGNIRA